MKYDEMPEYDMWCKCLCRCCIISLKGKHTNRLSLRFVDPDLETRYSVEKEKQSGAAFCCSCVVLLFTAVMEVLIDPWLVDKTISALWSLNPNSVIIRIIPAVSEVCVHVLWNRLIANYITFAVGEVLLLILTICSLAAIFPRVSFNTS